MIGQTGIFPTVFGGMAPGDLSYIIPAIKSAIYYGLSPVLLKPGTKETGCILSPTMAKRQDAYAQAAYVLEHPDQPAGHIRHACGFKHVLNDPAKVTVIVNRFAARYGGAPNIGLHLGRSRMLAVDVDTPEERQAFIELWGLNDQSKFPLLPDPPPLTVASPGAKNADGQWLHHGGGHWWFRLPDGFQLPAGKVYKGPGSWAAMWGESFVLVPPSSRAEGPYVLTGTELDAPAWLLDMIKVPRADSALSVNRPAPAGDVDSTWLNRGPQAGNPIDVWAAGVGWHNALTSDGWSMSGRYTCGCPNYKAPGSHASPKSATAHQAGCTEFDVSSGMGPLKIWTDHPPAGLPPEGAVTLFGYAQAVHYRGDSSATKRAIGVPENTPIPQVLMPDPKGRRELKVTKASQIAMRAAEWAWEEAGNQWIPHAALALVGGREGVGKTTICFSLIARITRGTLPGNLYGSPRACIVVATEDSWAHTIVPRLAAAGADLDKVLQVEPAEYAEVMPGLMLPNDIEEVAAIVKAWNVGLILLDPLLGSIGEKIDTHKDSDIRKALSPLSRLASDSGVTIIGLIHENKSQGVDKLTQFMGSRAITAVARAALLCVRDDDPAPDPSLPELADQPEQFLFGQLKSNLGPRVHQTLRYRLPGAVVGTDPESGLPIRTSRVEWTGSEPAQIEDMLAARKRAVKDQGKPVVRATGLVLAMLADATTGLGKYRSELIDHAESEGIPARTLDRAISQLVESGQIISDRSGTTAFYTIPAAGKPGETGGTV